MGLLVDVRFTPPCAVVEVRGDLDMSSEDDLVAVVDQALEQGCPVVAFDLTGVGFIDCAALGTLVASAHRLRARSGRLHLSAVSPVVARLLALTGTGRLLGHADSAAVVLAPRGKLASGDDRGGDVVQLGVALL